MRLHYLSRQPKKGVNEMKMILLVYNEAIDDEIMSALESCGIEYYTKWQKVLGKGKVTPPHLDTSVWPGANNVCMAAVEDNKVSPMLAQVRGLRKTLGKEDIKAFVLPLEELT